MKWQLPHPALVLLSVVALAAVCSWLLPAGDYARVDDPVTGRTLVVAGTYHAVEPSPVGVVGALTALPRGFVDAADVIATVLFAGGLWLVLERLGTLGRLVDALLALLHGRGLLAVPVVALFFAVMGAVENMQEEIIALIPALLVLGRGLGVDRVSVVAMSAGAAMVGSAFGPTNPFQAGIAMKIAELAPLTDGAVRTGLFVVAFLCWSGWTLRYAMRNRTAPHHDLRARAAVDVRDLLVFALAIAPIFAYVYGSVAWGWGFNELSAGFLAAGLVCGLIGGMKADATLAASFEGMQALLPAAVLIAFARGITLVLNDGHIIDTILHTLVTPLGALPPWLAALSMVPVHSLVHVIVPSVSGQAVLTMPIMVPLADLLQFPRVVAVTAYQVGAGLTEMFTPTNGALMAVLLAAGVPFNAWLRFAAGGIALCAVVGVAGMLVLG